MYTDNVSPEFRQALPDLSGDPDSMPDDVVSKRLIGRIVLQEGDKTRRGYFPVLVGPPAQQCLCAGNLAGLCADDRLEPQVEPCPVHHAVVLDRFQQILVVCAGPLLRGSVEPQAPRIMIIRLFSGEQGGLADSARRGQRLVRYLHRAACDIHRDQFFICQDTCFAVFPDLPVQFVGPGLVKAGQAEDKVGTVIAEYLAVPAQRIGKIIGQVPDQ